MKIPQLARTAAVAVFVLGTIPMVIDAPAAIAQLSANKPHEPVPCTPVGVTKEPDGTVWAIEDCGGANIKTRMTPVKPK